MLQLTTYSPEHHQSQVFESSPVIIGSDKGQSSECQFHVPDADVQAEHCEIHWSREDGQFQVRLVNHGRTLALDSGTRVHSGVSIDVDAPLVFWVGNTAVEIGDPYLGREHDDFLTVRPLSESILTGSDELEHSPAPATLAAWFEALGQLQKSCAGSQEFFDDAAKACFSPGGLDGAMVLLPKDAEFEVASSHVCFPEHGFSWRRDVVRMAVKQKAVVYHDSQNFPEEAHTDSGHAVIACPVVDAGGECRAVLYGFRSQHRRNSRHGIRPLEACFVQLIGQSLANSLTRSDSEADATRSRVLLEQTFSPRIAGKLQQDPKILDGQNCEVTVMFCDLRGFSTVAERVGPKVTYEFLTDVMDSFSSVIEVHGGVVIDFYGDGISAFWNAPIEVRDHAGAACRCAMDIAALMPQIARDWQSELRTGVRVGIGIHTGMALVGNSGSRHKLKYGPQGNTVNLTSRLEAATRHLGNTIILSGVTASRLSGDLVVRRACKAKLPGMKASTQLFDLVGRDTDLGAQRLADSYEEALTLFEQKDFSAAMDKLSQLSAQHAFDPLVKFLMDQCQQQSESREDDHDRASTREKIYPLFDSLESEQQA